MTSPSDAYHSVVQPSLAVTAEYQYQQTHELRQKIYTRCCKFPEDFQEIQEKIIPVDFQEC